MSLAEVMLVGINEQFQQALGKAYVSKTLSADAKKFVRKHEWPGNVRELRNVLVQSAVMSIDKTIRLLPSRSTVLTCVESTPRTR